MNISSNIDFVKHFVTNHDFFVASDTLYMVYEKEVIEFPSQKARRIVTVEYQNLVNKLAPSGTGLLENIESRVMMNEVPRYDKLYNRVMRYSGGIIYDLAEENQAVEITKDGYQVIDKSLKGYLNLKTFDVSLPQVRPVPSDKELFELLKKVTNFRTENDLKIFAVWVTSLLFPNLSTPILILLGEQGSGKSFASELVKRIIDPSKIGRQHKVRSVQDFAVLADKSYVCVIDNLSNITDEISDAMCQTVSKGQFSTRKLYTTNELETIEMQTKLVINGINIMNTKPDLLERSIVLHLDKLNSNEVLDEESLWEEFEQVLPLILDQLFLAISHAMKTIEHVSITHSPRMADFTKYIVAISDYYGITQEQILAIYQSNIKEVVELVIDDPVASALLSVLNTNDGSFEGSATELLELMKSFGFEGLPKAANALSRKLTRLKSDLAKESITIERSKDWEGNRTIRIEKK